MQLKRANAIVLTCVLISLSLFRGDACFAGDDPAHTKIADLLSKGDATAKLAALHDIREMMAQDDDMDRAVAGMRDAWLQAMLDGKMDAELLDITDPMVIASMRFPQRLQDLLIARTKALLALGKGKEALVEAKRLYNVCQMSKVPQSMTLLADALTMANPHDDVLVRRFKMQQMLSASHGSTTQPVEIKNNVLDTIVVDPEPYEKELPNYPQDNFFVMTARGDLLLLAGKSNEALDVFLRARDVVDTTNAINLAESIENVARAYKAVDGNVGRANAWLAEMSEKPK